MAIGYLTVGSATAANTASALNYSVNAIAANANGLLFLGIAYWDPLPEGVPTSTTGGETPSEIASAGDGEHQFSRIRYDQEATLSTSYAITNSFSTGQDEGICSATMVFDGVEQSGSPIRASNAATNGDLSTLLITLTGITVGDMIACAVSDYIDGAHTASNLTERYDAVNSSSTTAHAGGNLLADGTTETVGFTGANVTGSVGSLAAQAKADVNAEVVDALATDTYAEPAQGAPAATASLAAKIGFLFKAWRNRQTQTADTYSLYNDDAATVDHKATVADDATTFSRTEIATGP